MNSRRNFSTIFDHLKRQLIPYYRSAVRKSTEVENRMFDMISTTIYEKLVCWEHWLGSLLNRNTIHDDKWRSSRITAIFF
ncbi:hypothetical protein AYI69_g10481 [Smittium culicis]|uniref:Uncharacterized protein n=1 Tax=Smittium culicis TaxID=133412 RepID=A0A1R1X5C9_9FUNG|nr:hypothetical protein AYI69_g10481 [Smittium culicis]